MLAWSIAGLEGAVKFLTDSNTSVTFVSQGMTFTDASSPINTLMNFAIVQFQRELILEHREGIAIAKTNKVYKCRKAERSMRRKQQS